MEQPLTLDFLQSQYTLHLHIEERIESEDRAILAQKFHYNKVLCFVNYIGLNPSRQSDVRTAHDTMDAAAAMTMALEFWSNINPYRATFKNLLLYLLEHTEGEIAMAVCDHLFKRANKVYADPFLITQLYKVVLGIIIYGLIPYTVNHLLVVRVICVCVCGRSGVGFV